MLQLLLPRGLAKAKRETDATAKAFRDGRSLGKAFTASVAESDRLGAAQAFAHSLTVAWWRALTADDRRPIPLRRLFEPLDMAPLPDWALTFAASLGEEAAALDTSAAAYQIGLAYSGMLPREQRAALGVYYTPPMLAARLISPVLGTAVLFGCFDPAEREHRHAP